MLSSPHLTYTDTQWEHIWQVLIELYHILELNFAALMATEDPAVDTEPKCANWSAKEVEHIHPLHVAGKIKDHRKVLIKWGAIKQTYNAIITYCSKSGKHWDNEHGTNISGALAGENWSKYVAVKANILMKPFHNKGWEYMEYLEDIFPQGGATGAHTFCAGTSQYTIPSASTDDSISTPIHSHSTPVTSVASIGPAAPTSNLPASNPPISNPPTLSSPAPNPPTLNPTAPNSGGKHSFAVMSSEVADTTFPSLLFSDNHPPTGKCSQTSAQSAGNVKSQASHMVTVIAIDNMIQCLGHWLETMFMDPLIAVQTATTMIYKDPEMPTLHCAFMMHQFTDLYANLNEAGPSGNVSQSFTL
ncbi:hypothetical protein EDC04DRAFT_2612515 [Pisolithus marmoratus]|nr:hypothetical protein EDC04DRAFT_2612515 [Pisolithus marmoratus]